MAGILEKKQEVLQLSKAGELGKLSGLGRVRGPGGGADPRELSHTGEAVESLQLNFALLFPLNFANEVCG